MQKLRQTKIDSLEYSRGSPDRMVNGYKSYYDEMVANGMADISVLKNPTPSAV